MTRFSRMSIGLAGTLIFGFVMTSGGAIAQPVGPTVTIEQGSGQPDPTTTPSIVFDVTFSESVTEFTTGDVVLSGSAGATTAQVSGSNASYTVTVTGMTGPGDVVATIPAGVAKSALNDLSLASTSTDNTVIFSATPLSVTINQAGSQPDPTTTPSVDFTVLFSEPVTGFTESDLTLSGSAGATTAAVAGSGDTYTVTVTGMTGPGDVIAVVTAGVAQASSSGILNGASTSTDNTVTYLSSGPVTDESQQLSDVQEAATGVAAQLATDLITDSVSEEIASAISGQIQVVSASDGKVGFVYAPGMGKGTVITPTADITSGESGLATWRIWSSLRYSEFDSNALDGEQINAMIGASVLLDRGLIAGLAAGYENQDYEDSVSATLKGEGINVGAYLGGALGNGLRFDAQAHASFLDYDIAAGAVTGATEGTRLIVGGGLAHALDAGPLTIEPTARFSGTWEWQDGYTDSAAVAHAARDFNFGRVSAGAKIMHRFDIDGGASISPFITGFGDYRFSSGDAPIESLVDGMSARVGLGFDVRGSSGVTASALGELSGLGLDHGATAKSLKAQLAIPF